MSSSGMSSSYSEAQRCVHVQDLPIEINNISYNNISITTANNIINISYNINNIITFPLSVCGNATYKASSGNHQVVVLRFVSNIVVRLSYIIHHTSYITHHTSCIMHHTSYIIHHTSYIIHHTSYIIMNILIVISHTHIHSYTHTHKHTHTHFQVSELAH